MVVGCLVFSGCSKGDPKAEGTPTVTVTAPAPTVTVTVKPNVEKGKQKAENLARQACEKMSEVGTSYDLLVEATKLDESYSQYAEATVVIDTTSSDFNNPAYKEARAKISVLCDRLK